MVGQTILGKEQHQGVRGVGMLELTGVYDCLIFRSIQISSLQLDPDLH